MEVLSRSRRRKRRIENGARVVHCESAMWLGILCTQNRRRRWYAIEVHEMFTYSSFREEALEVK